MKSALQLKLEVLQILDGYKAEVSTTLQYEEHPLKQAELRDRFVVLDNLYDEILNLGFSLPPERRKA